MSIVVILELVIVLALLTIYMIILPAKSRRFPTNILFLTGIVVFVIFLQKISHHVFHLQNASLTELGLRFDTFWPAVKLLLPVAIVMGLAFLITGLCRKKIAINRHFLITFFFYPASALAQQYLILGFFFQEFQRFFGTSIINILLCAAIFSFLHYPSKLFMLVTFFAALIWLWVFIQAPSLFASAFFHGWLGTMFYYFVLGEGSLDNFLKQSKKR